MTIYTDASHLAYANLGGWAYVRSDGHRRSGIVEHLDNNRLELWAVLEALASLRRPTDVTLYTDSNYVIYASGQRRPKDDLTYELQLWLNIHRVVIVKSKSQKNEAHHLAREAVFMKVVSPHSISHCSRVFDSCRQS